MSRNERHRTDKRASSSRARSKGIFKFIDIKNIYYDFIIINSRIPKKRVGKCC